MSRPLRRDAHEYEGLLDGTVEVDTPLADLMSALKAPDQPEEFDGLAAAMSAFFTVGPAAHPAAFTPTPAPRRAPRHRRAGRSLLLKLGLAFGGASVVGGVALAAYVSNSHEAPGHRPGTQPGAGASSSVGAGGPVFGSSTGEAPPTKGAHKSTPAASPSVPGGGGVASQPTDITHPAHPSHTRHSPGGKPSTTPSASQTHPGNSGHTKHTSHPHPSPTHPTRPSR